MDCNKCTTLVRDGDSGRVIHCTLHQRCCDPEQFSKKKKKELKLSSCQGLKVGGESA